MTTSKDLSRAQLRVLTALWMGEYVKSNAQTFNSLNNLGLIDLDWSSGRAWVVTPLGQRVLAGV